MKKLSVIVVLIFSVFGSAFAQKDQPLKIIEQPTPERPKNYKTLNITGTVTLRVEFLSDGDIGSIDVINPLIPDLDTLAVEAAKQIKFQPAIVYGKVSKTDKIIIYSYDQNFNGWRNPTEPIIQTYKFDETSQLRWDLGEVFVLYDFADELNRMPEEDKGIIILYGKIGWAIRYGKAVKNFMMNYRGVDPKRISSIYGGELEEPKIELFIVPKNGVSPKMNIKTDYKKPTDFDNYSVSDCEPCGYLRTDALKNFAAELKKHPAVNAYIIVRPSKSEYSEVKTRRQAMKTAAVEKRFLNRLGIRNSRIFTIVGNLNNGYEEVNLWIVPLGKDFPRSTL